MEKCRAAVDLQAFLKLGNRGPASSSATFCDFSLEMRSAFTSSHTLNDAEKALFVAQLLQRRSFASRKP